MKYPKERQEQENNFFFFFSKSISKIFLKHIFYKYYFYKIYVFEIRFFPLFLFKFTFFKNEKNVYNILKLCIFYKSIANKKTYYFYTIFILDFLLFFIRNNYSKSGFPLTSLNNKIDNHKNDIDNNNENIKETEN